MTINKKFFIIFISLFIIIAILGGIVYFDLARIPPHSLGPPAAESAEGVASANLLIIPVNKPTDVMVTIQITDSRLISGSINLQRLDTSGKVLAILGNLNDSGTNGDAVAGDKIYTVRYNFNEVTTTPVRLRVSWALKGVLKRVVSNTLTIEVGNSLDEKGLILTYPPDLQFDQETLNLGGPISLNNFANAYKAGGIIPEGGTEIDITNTPLPVSPLSDIIAKDLQDAVIESADTILVGGYTGTKVVYIDSFTSTLTYKNVAVYVPHGVLLYKFFISYHAGDPLEANFLSSFQQILNTVQFTQ